MEYLKYNTTLAVCDTTVGNVLKQLLIDFPTVLDNIQCTIPTCNKTTKLPISVPYITLHITNGQLNSLEEDINNRLVVENSICHHVDTEGQRCEGIKTIRPVASSMHILIELLHWEGIL